MKLVDKTHAEPWRVFSQRWERYYTPPGRPSKQAVEVYTAEVEKIIKNTSRKVRAIVFGSTPELRDLLAKFDCEVTFIDISEEMMRAMTELTKVKNPNEKVVRGNWMENDLPDNYFDVALGDLVINNVPLEDQEKFIQTIHRVLNETGKFITKIHVILDSNERKKSFDDILLMYADFAEDKNTAMELFCHFLYLSWDEKTCRTDAKVIRDWMKKYKKGYSYVHENKGATKILNEMWGMWEPMEKESSVLFEKDRKKQLEKYFILEKEIVLSDCHYPIVDKSFPIWVLKKR